jgi:hypothetical protein
MTGRILFVCAQKSSRALLAASLLHAQGVVQWEAWSTPPHKEQETHVVEQVLQEQGMSLLPSNRCLGSAGNKALYCAVEARIPDR